MNQLSIAILNGLWHKKKVDKVKREGGAKHSDINVNAFLIQIMPECFAPTD